MSEAVCQCDHDARGAIYCERHRTTKIPRLVQLCNAGARGESPGLRYWEAWEAGHGPGRSDGRSRRRAPVTYLSRIEATISSAVSAAERQLIERRRIWRDEGLTLEQCRGLCGARPLADIRASLTHCVERCLEYDLSLERCGRHGLSCEAKTRWIEDTLHRRCDLEQDYAMRCGRTATRFVTLDDLRADTLALASRLPPTITDVVGIARSGVLPASTLACLLHVQLWSISPTGLQNLGTTYRLRQSHAQPAHVLLVDDTANTGKAIRRYAAAVRRAWPDAAVTRAVVYTTPAARSGLDLYAVELPAPHYLEWHLFNSPFAHAAMDFDGILCQDIGVEDDDDGPRYRAALAAAKPKYLVRYCAIPLVITARLGRPEYRAITRQWLDRHGITVDRLEMGPWQSLSERNQPGVVAGWKARMYKDSDLRLMIESCPIQARHIAGQSAKPVLCPEAKLVYRQ